MTKKLWALGALIACVAGVALPGGAAGRAGDCRPLRAIFYTSTDWLRLAQVLAANPSPCAQYYISVPPPNPDKATLRSGAAAQIRALGPNFHALAEINVSAWAGWTSANGGDWYDAGLEARQRMAAAGYDVGQGDTWALNELSSSVRTTPGTVRQNMRDFVHGLYDGGGSHAQGVVFAQGVAQGTGTLGLVKANLEAWYQDTGFWTDIGSYVSDFLQENYGDARDYGVSGASPTDRLSFLEQYLEQDVELADAAPAGAAAAAQSALNATYAPLATAAWPWATKYGYTQIPYDQMQDYVTAEIAAMRAYDASLGWSTDRIGLSWAPNAAGSGLSAGDFASQSKAILTQLAAAIAQSGDTTSGGACQGAWCTAAVAGAAFTNRWSTFSTWTPTRPVFTSAPQTVGVGAASAPLTVQLRTGGGTPSLPFPVDVSFATTSPTGGFATDPNGPWTPTLELTLPAGSSTATVYLEDSTVGAPAVTVSALGATATQAETVAPPTAAGLTTQASAIHLGSVLFANRAGRLAVTLRLLTSAGGAVPRAAISIAIMRGATTFAATVGHTDGAGSLRVLAGPKATSGCYAVHVKSIRLDGYSWRVLQPAGRFCVR